MEVYRKKARKPHGGQQSVCLKLMMMNSRPMCRYSVDCVSLVSKDTVLVQFTSVHFILQ